MVELGRRRSHIDKHRPEADLSWNIACPSKSKNNVGKSRRANPKGVRRHVADIWSTRVIASTSLASPSRGVSQHCRIISPTCNRMLVDSRRSFRLSGVAGGSIWSTLMAISPPGESQSQHCAVSCMCHFGKSHESRSMGPPRLELCVFRLWGGGPAKSRSLEHVRTLMATT